MSKRTVLKVDTSCARCKRKVLQAVSGLQGVDKIEVDSENSTMTVTGSVDPVAVITQARKTGKRASVVTIGSPAAEEKKKPEQQQPNKKADDDEKKPEQQQRKKAGEEKKSADAAERRAPEQPAVVFVHHHVPASWPCAAPMYHERVVYEQDPPPCSIM